MGGPIEVPADLCVQFQVHAVPIAMPDNILGRQMPFSYPFFQRFRPVSEMHHWHAVIVLVLHDGGNTFAIIHVLFLQCVFYKD